MSDLIDSVFKRQCSLKAPAAAAAAAAAAAKEEEDGFTQDVEFTVLQVGTERAVDIHRCSTHTELRHYLDEQRIRLEQTDDEDYFWPPPKAPQPDCMKLFFLHSPTSDQDDSSPFSKSMPGNLGALQKQIGLHESSDDTTDGDTTDGEPVSPSAPPRRAKHRHRLSRTAAPRVFLEPIEEDRLVTRQTHRGPLRNWWTWDTRHIRSTTLTIADPFGTTYFCINYPQKLQKRIADSIRSLKALATSPLFMDTLIIDEIIAFYRDIIKLNRNKLLAMKDDDSSATETSIKLEELATIWRTILKDINTIQRHIHHLQELATETAEQRRPRTPSPSRQPRADRSHRHTRQQSSEVLGPKAAEIFNLQDSTCEFWAKCVNMYLERTTDRIRNSTYRLRKTIPLRRRGSLPQLNRRLSNFTIEVAVQFQRNTGSMSTLALSFLSTVFFSPDGLLFAITYWWWILVTLVVPLTFIIIHLWFETLANSTPFLQRLKPQAQQQLDNVEEEEEEPDQATH